MPSILTDVIHPQDCANESCWIFYDPVGKAKPRPGMMAQAHNLNYLGEEDWEYCSLKHDPTGAGGLVHENPSQPIAEHGYIVPSPQLHGEAEIGRLWSRPAQA
jgi:hypothetical protein